MARLIKADPGLTPDPDREPAYPHTRLIKGGLARLEAETARRQGELEELANRMQQMLREADEQAAAVRAAAAIEAEGIRTVAFEEGVSAGRAAIENLSNALSAHCESATADLLSQIPELALAIAGKVLRVELTHRPSAIRQIVRRALKRACYFRSVRLLVNPVDYQVVAKISMSLKSLLIHVQQFEVRADPDTPRFGVRLETDRGALDASLETQLERVAARINRLIKTRPSRAISAASEPATCS